MLQRHLRLRLQANTGTENIDQSRALLSQSIDYRSPRWGERGLEHIAKHAENTVEAFVTAGSGSVISLPADASHQFGQDDQIDDQGRCQEGILANVEQTDGLMAAHEDLGVVLIQGSLVVPHGRHVLDHHGVVRMLIVLVEQVIGRDHVVDHVGLGDLLGPELLLRTQVLPVIVAKVVVAGDRGEFDARVDQKVHQRRFHLGLPGFEVVAADEGLVFLSKVNRPRHQGVLRRPVDERRLLQDAGHREDGRRRHLLVTGLDRGQEIFRRVVEPRAEIGIPFRVGGPQNDNLVEGIAGFEFAIYLLDHKPLSRRTWLLTEYPSGYARHDPTRPWIPEERYPPGPPGWRR